MFNDGVVQGDSSPFQAMTDGRCVKARSSIVVPEYSKKYTITVTVNFDAGEYVAEAEIVNLVADSFLPDNIMSLDADGNGSLSLFTSGLIPTDKTFTAESEWTNETPPKLKITVKLVDK